MKCVCKNERVNESTDFGRVFSGFSLCLGFFLLLLWLLRGAGGASPADGTVRRGFNK